MARVTGFVLEYNSHFIQSTASYSHRTRPCLVLAEHGASHGIVALCLACGVPFPAPLGRRGFRPWLPPIIQAFRLLINRKYCLATTQPQSASTLTHSILRHAGAGSLYRSSIAKYERQAVCDRPIAPPMYGLFPFSCRHHGGSKTFKAAALQASGRNRCLKRVAIAAESALQDS